MRSTSKTMIVAMLAVLATSALASASASASECPSTEKGGDVGLCIEGKEQRGLEPAFVAEKAAGTEMEMQHGAGGVVIRCTQAKSKAGVFDTTDLANLELDAQSIEFAGCEAVSSPTKCEVLPFALDGDGHGLDGAFAGENTEGVTLKAAEGSTLGRVTIRSKAGQVCGFALNKSPVTGTAPCTLQHSTTDALGHELACNSQLGTWTLVVTEKLELAEPNRGKKWSIQRS